MNIFENYKIRRETQNLGKLTIPVDNAKQFSDVYHITHLNAAKYLLETEKIIPQLIQDKSQLNGQLIKVVWLSPNEWIQGSLYGNVRFTYSFNDLIKDKKFYSVEVMEDYNPPACRILISDKDFSDHEILKPYDPRKQYDGPWHIDEKDQNFKHESYNIEFMFDGEISIGKASRIDFVDHHQSLCNIFDSGACPDVTMKGGEAKRLFISYLIASNIKLKNLHIHITDTNWSIWQITTIFKAILEILFQNSQYSENNIFPDDSKLQLCRSIIEQIGKKDNDAAINLSQIFSSKEDLSSTIKKLFAEYFEIEENQIDS